MVKRYRYHYILILISFLLLASCGIDKNGDINQSQSVHNIVATISSKIEEDKIKSLDYVEEILGVIDDENFVVLKNNINNKAISIINPKTNEEIKKIKELSLDTIIYTSCVNSNFIVWGETKQSMIRDDWEIYYFDISENTTNLINKSLVSADDLKLPTMSEVAPYVNIHDNLVTYNMYTAPSDDIRNSQSTSSINMFDLEKNYNSVLAEIPVSEGSFCMTDIDNGYIAYDISIPLLDEMSNRDTFVLSKIDQLENKKVLSSSEKSRGISLEYPYVIYSVDGDSLHLYNIEEPKDEVIIKSPSSSYMYLPTSANGIVCWVDFSKNIFFYSIKENRIYNILNSNDNIGEVKIKSNVIYWIESINGNDVTRYITT